METAPRHAVEVLTEVLGRPRRRMLASSDGAEVDAVAWDCGCRAHTCDAELRRWEPCGEHTPFRDAVMARLAVVGARAR